MIKRILKREISIKIATPIILLAVALSFVGIVYASNPPCGGSAPDGNHTFNCYQVPNQSSPATQVDQWHHCKDVTNTTSGGFQVFIPTNTDNEWEHIWNSFYVKPSGLTVNDCPTGNGGPFSLEYVTHCPNVNETLATAEDTVTNLLVQAINSSTWASAEKTAAVNALNSQGLIWQNTLTAHTLSSGGYTWNYSTYWIIEVDEFFAPPCTNWTVDIVSFGH